MKKIYILFERSRFNYEVKYVSESRHKVRCAARDNYNLDGQDCAMLNKYNSITIGNPKNNSDDVFIEISIQCVETDKIINNLK